MGFADIIQPSTIMKTIGKATGTFAFADSFAAKNNANYKSAQKYVDSEVLRYCATLVPLQTGYLKNSGTLGTTIGSGEVHYIAPYSAVQYYNTGFDHSQQSNPQGGALWFERMKTAHLQDIKDGVKKLFD